MAAKQDPAIKAKIFITVEESREYALAIPRASFVSMLKAHGYEIPVEAQISIDTRGCYCDNTPELDDDHALNITWKVRVTETREE